MTPEIGGRTLTRVLARNDLLGRSPDEFLDLSPAAYREEYRLKPKSVEAMTLDRRTYLKSMLSLEERLNGLGVTLVTSSDAHYPALIEEIDPDPPGMLFLYGNLRLLEGRTFCVMSSRNARPADLDLIERITEEGVLEGEVLVTSHNKLEYQRSAIVPLRWGSPRILCLDCGLFPALGPDLRDELFPSARLWRYEFDAKTDLVVSPFRPDAPFIGTNNKIRDRLVAGLSRRLDFVHISERGNMADLVRMALRAGRRVRISDRIIGYRDLRAEGAEVISA
jgi:DNA processing protein